MSIRAILLIRKHGKATKAYKKRLCSYANAQGYHIEQIIYVKDHSPIIYPNGRSLVIDQLAEMKATTVLIYSFQHLSQKKEELLQIMKALHQADIQCYAILEQMYLQEIKQFLLSPRR